MDKESLELAEGVAKEAAKNQVEERSIAMNVIKILKNVMIGQFIIIIILVGIIGFMFYEFTQYDYISTTTTVDSKDGGNAIINEGGDVNINGESNKDKENQD